MNNSPQSAKKRCHPCARMACLARVITDVTSRKKPENRMESEKNTTFANNDGYRLHTMLQTLPVTTCDGRYRAVPLPAADEEQHGGLALSRLFQRWLETTGRDIQQDVSATL